MQLAVYVLPDRRLPLMAGFLHALGTLGLPRAYLDVHAWVQLMLAEVLGYALLVVSFYEEGIRYLVSCLRCGLSICCCIDQTDPSRIIRRGDGRAVAHWLELDRVHVS